MFEYTPILPEGSDLDPDGMIADAIRQLMTGLASGVVTIESNGRRKTYRSVAEIRSAIDHFEQLGGYGKYARRRRRSRFMAASFTRS
jgi:hypothetical protein